MVFQLLADKFRSAYVKGEVCILYLSRLVPQITCPSLSTALPGFSQSQLPAQHLRRQKWHLLAKGGAGPCEQPTWQSRASRKQAGCGKASEEQCAHVPTAVLRDQAPSRQLRFAGLVKGKKTYCQEVGQG